MNMIFPFMGERGNKHCLTHFTLSFGGRTVCLCIIVWSHFLWTQDTLRMLRKFVFSIICMLNCCLSSDNAQKRLHSIKLFFFFFPVYTFWLLFCTDIHVLLDCRFLYGSCIGVCISFKNISSLTYYSWSFISAMWMWTYLTKEFHHF